MFTETEGKNIHTSEFYPQSRRVKKSYFISIYFGLIEKSQSEKISNLTKLFLIKISLIVKLMVEL